MKSITGYINHTDEDDKPGRQTIQTGIILQSRTKMSMSKPRQDQRRLVTRFILTYLLLMGLFLLLIGLEPVKKILDINGIYSRMIVQLTALCLKPFDIVQRSFGSIIQLKGLALDVRFGCNGLEAFLIYTVAILSFPATAAKKTAGILGGFILLQALNIARIAGLALSGIYLRDYFHYIHIYVAQGLMIAIALVLFLGWLNYATSK